MSPNGKVTYEVVRQVPDPLPESVERGQRTLVRVRRRLLEASLLLGAVQLSCWLWILGGTLWATIPLTLAAGLMGFFLGIRWALRDLAVLLAALQVSLTREDVKGRERT